MALEIEKTKAMEDFLLATTQKNLMALKTIVQRTPKKFLNFKDGFDEMTRKRKDPLLEACKNGALEIVIYFNEIDDFDEDEDDELQKQMKEFILLSMDDAVGEEDEDYDYGTCSLFDEEKNDQVADVDDNENEDNDNDDDNIIGFRFFWRESIAIAIENNHFDIVKYITENRKFKGTTQYMDLAAGMGNLEIVKYLHNNQSGGCSRMAMDKAAENGHLSIVEFLDKNREEGCTFQAMDKAAENGHLEVVKYLHANRREGCSTNAIDLAARKGHLNVLQFLYLNRTEGAGPYALTYACRGSYFEVVEFLLDVAPDHFKTYNSGNTALEAAVYSYGKNSLPIVKLIYEKLAPSLNLTLENLMQSACANQNRDVADFFSQEIEKKNDTGTILTEKEKLARERKRKRILDNNMFMYSDMNR